MEDIITPQTLPGTEPQNGTAAADGTGAVSEPGVVEAKDFLKQITGKDFPTNEAAIKSVQDTYKYVGESGQKIKTMETQLTEAQNAAAATPELAQTVAQLQAQVAQNEFYNSNPQYNTPEAKALISKFGSNPAEVIKDDLFVKTFTALKTTAEMDQSKSVLHSNPRLGQAQDNMTQASEALKAGNTAAAENNAVAGVIEAYGLV